MTLKKNITFKGDGMEVAAAEKKGTRCYVL